MEIHIGYTFLRKCNLEEAGLDLNEKCSVAAKGNTNLEARMDEHAVVFILTVGLGAPVERVDRQPLKLL